MWDYYRYFLFLIFSQMRYLTPNKGRQYLPYNVWKRLNQIIHGKLSAYSKNSMSSVISYGCFSCC